ncbi:MAG TPA: hypothetical protein VIJ36_10920 [Thermoanaerobaculia bacterium]
MSKARQTILLIALAALALLAALQWAGLLRLEQDEIVTIPVAAAHPAVRAGRPGARPGDRIASLRTEDLERVRAGGMGGRDPWRFVDPPPIPQRKSTEPQPEAQAPMALKPAESPLPHPDDFTLRYLGRFGPPEKHIAVFTDGRRVLNRQEGEVLDGRFIVSRIGYESVEIRFVGFPEVPARRVGVAAGRR